MSSGCDSASMDTLQRWRAQSGRRTHQQIYHNHVLPVSTLQLRE